MHVYTFMYDWCGSFFHYFHFSFFNDMSKFQVFPSINDCHVKRTWSCFTLSWLWNTLYWHVLFTVDLFSMVTFGIMSIMKTSSGIVASYRQFMLGVNVIFKHRPRKLLCNLSRINYSKVYKPVWKLSISLWSVGHACQSEFSAEKSAHRLVFC